MRVMRGALAGLIGLALAGCAVGADQATRSPEPTLASPDASSLPTATIRASPSIAAPGTPGPTRTAGATVSPRPTALPIPPKPSGLRVHEAIEEYCDPHDPLSTCGIGDSTFTVSWDQPRAKSVTIRLDGVTKCFGTDGSGRILDGWCLREHTPVPTSVRVLLAAAPAAEGRVTFRMAQSEDWYETLDGRHVYAFVLAAYNAEGGHSIFAIADRSEYCRLADVDCPGETDPEG